MGLINSPPVSCCAELEFYEEMDENKFVTEQQRLIIKNIPAISFLWHAFLGVFGSLIIHFHSSAVHLVSSWQHHFPG